MNREIFKAKIAEVISSTNRSGNEKLEAILAVVDAYSSAGNGTKPNVSGSLLPPDKIWLLKEVASSYIYETAEEGTYSIATQGIEKILEYYELQRQQ